MIAAAHPVQRPADARLLAVDRAGRISHWPRRRFIDLLARGDLVIANDAATLPASLIGVHRESGRPIEVRLARRESLEEMARFAAIVFGAGDYRTRTEDRAPPPPFAASDSLHLGPLHATVESVGEHPRLLEIRFSGTRDEIWQGLARHGRPIQYAHVPAPLALWDVWTPIAWMPVAFEAPSAGFVLDWRVIAAMRARGVEFATLTHAAGLSSTGDAALDRLLPFDEPYRIREATARAIGAARARGGRVIAIGTTVVRALEHAVDANGRVYAGDGIATQRIDERTELRLVDTILSGTHERGTSHHELLRAFADDETLARADAALEGGAYLTHEFGDSVLIEKAARKVVSGTTFRPVPF
ncbi:MAG: S-adenosylmethionine:tRNA ribosyltransferase-isomerase [Usitatibacter sp.]